MIDANYGFGGLTVNLPMDDLRLSTKVSIFCELYREMLKAAGGPISVEAQQEVDRAFEAWSTPKKEKL